MKKTFYKGLLLAFTFFLATSLEGQNNGFKISFLQENLKKTIDGTWVKDTSASKDYQSQITIKSIKFTSDKRIKPAFKNILNSYFDDYAYKTAWRSITTKIVNTGTGDLLFFLIKNGNIDYPRKFKYCLFKQEDKYYLLILTDLEDRHEDISFLFEVENFKKDTDYIIIEHSQMGKYQINKKQ
jgi:hypothetical protein